MARGIPTKSQVMGVLIELVNDGKLGPHAVAVFRDSSTLHQHTEDLIREYFPDWLPYKTPVLQADGLEMVPVPLSKDPVKTPVPAVPPSRPDAPWKF